MEMAQELKCFYQRLVFSVPCTSYVRDISESKECGIESMTHVLNTELILNECVYINVPVLSLEGINEKYKPHSVVALK